MGMPDPRDQSSLLMLKKVQAGISRDQENLVCLVKPGKIGNLGSRLHNFLWFLQAGRASPWVSTFIRPGDRRCMGRHLGRFSNGSTDDPDPCIWRNQSAINLVSVQTLWWALRDQTSALWERFLIMLQGRGTQPGAFFLDLSQSTVAKHWFVEEIRHIGSSTRFTYSSSTTWGTASRLGQRQWLLWRELRTLWSRQWAGGIVQPSFAHQRRGWPRQLHWQMQGLLHLDCLSRLTLLLPSRLWLQVLLRTIITCIVLCHVYSWRVYIYYSI